MKIDTLVAYIKILSTDVAFWAKYCIFLSKVWTLFHFCWYVQLLKHVTLISETYICEQCLHCCLQTRFKPEGCNLPGFDNCSIIMLINTGSYKYRASSYKLIRCTFLIPSLVTCCHKIHGWEKKLEVIEILWHNFTEL